MSWNIFSSTKPLPNAPGPIFERKSTTLAVILLAVLGAFLNFIGVCINHAKGRSNNALWYHTFFYIAVLIAFCVLTMVTSFDQHRMTMMAFLAIGFVYLTDDLNSQYDNVHQSSYATSFTGCLFMTFAWIYMMIFTGGIPRSM
jgi:lysylphosphatidylglycerol synthetase-like protein (DUF2156 family)